MTSPCASQKQTSQSEGFSTRAHVLCPSVTCTVHSANRTHRAGHVEFHTRVHVGNPSSPNPATQPGLCPSAGSATSTAGVPGPSFTPAAEHVGASCVARHGPHARCCANPARSPLKLQPLLGPRLSTVAVSVSFLPTRSNSRVSRDSFCTPSHSHRETRLHAHACRPTSPLHTATSHTLFSSHTVAHSLVPHSRRPHHSHPRGHSPAVFHTHGVHTHMPLPARTWFPPAAVPLSHTACRESRTPAHP